MPVHIITLIILYEKRETFSIAGRNKFRTDKTYDSRASSLNSRAELGGSEQRGEHRINVPSSIYVALSEGDQAKDRNGELKYEDHANCILRNHFTTRKDNYLIYATYSRFFLKSTSTKVKCHKFFPATFRNTRHPFAVDTNRSSSAKCNRFPSTRTTAHYHYWY
ncbi:hypothetical protein PUN28_008856 [Cardiocondyla obscurior]|uniref:Uncharacterized protein n=1 Tax=Cardiocondyla obscurior TaxID=286306 RepID=A0AAW2FP84_9HYME